MKLETLIEEENTNKFASFPNNPSNRKWDEFLPNGLRWDSYKKRLDDMNAMARKIRLIVHSGMEETHGLVQEAGKNITKATQAFRREFLEHRKHAIEALKKGEDVSSAVIRRGRSDEEMDKELKQMRADLERQKFGM